MKNMPSKFYTPPKHAMKCITYNNTENPNDVIF